MVGLGLGSGRRSARSTPPLLLVLLLALSACMAFLVLTYWLSSARSSELQARVAVLNTEMRRVASDVGVAELAKYQLQVQLQGQREEAERQAQLHQQYLQSEIRACHDVKENLNKNITSSTKIIQTLQEQFQQLQRGYGQINQKLQDLQKKLTYDITQCSNQINDQKELYEEQIKVLNRRLADATKLQTGNRDTESTDQTKLLPKEYKPTDKQETNDPHQELQSPKEDNDPTSQLEVKTNEVDIMTKIVSEKENKLHDSSVGENNQHHLDTSQQGNTDHRRNPGEVMEDDKK
ncbi:Golgi membrane protein 1-like isoform X2 [Leucoraja erinacea]|uniref:Golgi membrane protein 1-like isoform X2 n=1 Tax=Leucoraja erinaceus TaxID=7782 RepID=UPI0024577B1A|nr:Golgi membrane protein 1-like isoform X2 [Leucoraja erinacea]